MSVQVSVQRVRVLVKVTISHLCGDIFFWFMIPYGIAACA